MQQVTFKLEGEVPAKKNSRVFSMKLKRSFPSAHYTAWHNEALAQLHLKQIQPFTKPVRIELLFVHGDKRRRDSDNGTSSVFDTLVDAGIISDDNWNNVPEFIVRNDYSKSQPCVYVKITEIAE